MASKPRSEWSDSYRARIESFERRHPGFTRTQARGQAAREAGADKPRLGIREIETIRDRLAGQPPEQIVIEHDRDRVIVTDATGQTRIYNRSEWKQVDRGVRRPRRGPKAPNVFEYRKRKRKAA